MGIPALNITAQTTLGAKLVLSSAYFDASAAEIIGAEGHKLQTIIAAYSAGSLSIDALKIFKTCGTISSATIFPML